MAALASKCSIFSCGQPVELDRAINDFHHYLGWRLFDHELAETWQTKFEPELMSAAPGK